MLLLVDGGPLVDTELGPSATGATRMDGDEETA